MTRQAIICGLGLVVIGLFGYVQGKEKTDPENAAAQTDYMKRKAKGEDVAEPKPKSVMTALIPAAFGGVLILCGLVVALKPGLRKHVMHFAALVGVVGAVSGFVPAILRGFDLENPAVWNGLLMTVVCVVFVILCVMSFVEARRSQPAAPPV